MESKDFDLVKLIENNEMTRLSKNYHSELINKIREKFSESQQRIFVGSFYCYLNYDANKDFVIDLDTVWEWVGFNKKSDCKRILDKYFVERIDYKREIPRSIREENFAAEISAAKTENRGGHNREMIMLTVNAFKKLCLRARTEKADEVHDYFIKLEAIFHELLEKETSELRMQLTAQDTRTNSRIKSKEEKIIDQFQDGEMCIYIADIGVHDEERYIKFGESNELRRRISDHRNNFKEFGFELIAAYRVVNSKKFEKLLKNESIIKYRRRNLTVKKHNYTELVMVDNTFTIEDLDNLIKDLVKKHCSIEAVEYEYNFKKLEIDLKKEEEKTKQDEIAFRQIEIQEKTKQMEMEVRLLELKLQQSNPSTLQPVLTQPVKAKEQKPKPQVSTPTIQQPTVTQFTSGLLTTTLTDLLEKSKLSKVTLLTILQHLETKYSDPKLKSAGYGHYHGFSLEFKKEVEECIKSVYGLQAIKNNGSIYYLGLRLAGYTSLFPVTVYRDFVNEKIDIIDESIRYEKIPPGMFKYKAQLDTLMDLFEVFTVNSVPMFSIRCSTGFTTMYKREFIEMICKICDVKEPSYTAKTVKFFNGIVIKQV
jgi:phage anti-repressor protein